MEELNSSIKTHSEDASIDTISGQLEMDTSSNNSGVKAEDTSSLLLGKFKDVDALKNAYASLEAEYTRKCQILAEKEKSAEPSKAENSQNPPASSISQLSGEEKDEILQEYIFSHPDLKDKFVAKYFDELNTPSSPKLISSDRGSGYVLSPKVTPRTLEEAGKLALDMLDGNNDK